MHRLSPLLLIAALLAAPSAQAAFTFTFVGAFTSGFDDGGEPMTSTATFSVTRPGPITTDGLVVPDTCTTTSAEWVCRPTGQWMNVSGTPNGFSPVTTPVAFIGLNLDEIAGGSFSGYYFFDRVAFSTPGVYSVWTYVQGDITNGTDYFGNAGQATLTVTRTLDPGVPGTVPLPMSLALLGPALLGLALARRR